MPGRGKSTDKASAEVGKQEVRSQFDSGLGYGVQMAEAGAARAPWGLLGVGGRGKEGTAGVPGVGWGVLQRREVRRPPCPHRTPLQGLAVWEVQRVLRKWSDWITGKIKAAKLGLGLGGSVREGNCTGPAAGRAREAAGSEGWGLGSHIRQEALLTPVSLECGVRKQGHSHLEGAGGRVGAETPSGGGGRDRGGGGDRPGGGGGGEGKRGDPERRGSGERERREERGERERDGGLRLEGVDLGAEPQPEPRPERVSGVPSLSRLGSRGHRLPVGCWWRAACKTSEAAGKGLGLWSALLLSRPPPTSQSPPPT